MRVRFLIRKCYLGNGTGGLDAIDPDLPKAEHEGVELVTK